MHYLDEGAYTGEISAPMLKQIGVTYVLIGHSERRQYYAENDETVNLKIKQALRHSLTPMVCIGEPLEQRENGTTEEYLHEQIVNGLHMLTKEEVKIIIIAYEPIWAIGTGRTASSIQANESIGFIRSELVKLYDKETAEEIPILYGGSVNLKNAEELLKCKEIDGALIGGASLKAQTLLEIINIASKILK
jgi:triosephosphate isomerase